VAGFVEVDVDVDHAGQHVQPACVDLARPAGRSAPIATMLSPSIATSARSTLPVSRRSRRG
jgi:hypothetical protein